MALFSQRHGHKPIKSVLQTGNIDRELRSCLWNALLTCYWAVAQNSAFPVSVSDDSDTVTLFIRLVNNYFKDPLDAWPKSYAGYVRKIRKYFFACRWFEVYDFIEFVANNNPTGNYPTAERNEKFIEICNHVLKRELSAYRFVGGRVTQITSEAEVEEIEAALALPFPLKPVSTHIQTSLDLFSDRKTPDYRNSIKESISAVESICRLITGDPNATLGQALKRIETAVGLHPALKEAFSRFYGYTSDADGIRHALMEESNLDFGDAKFMLVSCSAFVNYLIDKSDKAGITF